ncbi:MAG: dihydrofolate reductase family protein [Acidimicrobiia bacterium]
MGKIVSQFFISLDGVVEAPNEWHFPYFNEEMGQAIEASTVSNKAFLMGRVLYDEWAAYWPKQSDEVPFAAFINNVAKYVVSSTLTAATWNDTSVISGDVAGGIRELKERTAGDIGMSGSATLVRWLLANDLLDELHLMMHPIVVGRGQRLFEDTPRHPLQLLSHETFQTGVLNLKYAPANG